MIFFHLALGFRYQQHGKKQNSFCGEFHLLSNYRISEMFYSCGWLHKEYEDSAFSLDYEAFEPPFKDTRKYVFRIPLLEHIGKKVFNIKLFLS
jgi:hypothetical protein